MKVLFAVKKEPDSEPSCISRTGKGPETSLTCDTLIVRSLLRSPDVVVAAFLEESSREMNYARAVVGGLVFVS